VKPCYRSKTGFAGNEEEVGTLPLKNYISEHAVTRERECTLGTFYPMTGSIKSLPACVRRSTGASLDRPALQRLLADVRAGTIDIVLVYKVDRLTRSLADFAKLIELFDAHDVSFVSVTQSFNTSSSMGRLTLNVLLSFAQFERELIGERVRDKIAASKRKGIWVGGPVPLGYSLAYGPSTMRLAWNRSPRSVVLKLGIGTQGEVLVVAGGARCPVLRCPARSLSPQPTKSPLRNPSHRQSTVLMFDYCEACRIEDFVGSSAPLQ
jgi:hypothetical protein